MSYFQVLTLAMPETIVSLAALVVLFVDLGIMRAAEGKFRRMAAAAFTGTGCLVAIFWMHQVHQQATPDLLGGMLVVDPLTQLVNRRALTIRLVTEMERVRRYNAPLSMLLIDLDHFKLVNDTYGHMAGDDVLASVATLLQRAVRSVDIVARYGGEEFIIVLPETGRQGAMMFAERVRERISTHGFAIGENQTIRVTSSIGVATYPSPRLDSVEDLFRAADIALYRAKGNGRNLVCS